MMTLSYSAPPPPPSALYLTCGNPKQLRATFWSLSKGSSMTTCASMTGMPVRGSTDGVSANGLLRAPRPTLIPTREASNCRPKNAKNLTSTSPGVMPLRRHEMTVRCGAVRYVSEERETASTAGKTDKQELLVLLPSQNLCTKLS